MAELNSVKYSDSQTPKEFKGETVPMWKLIILASPRMATQMCWGCIGAVWQPLLNSLLPASFATITGIAGPIAGVVFSPLAGALSDRCTSKFGRRRPFIVFGGIINIVAWQILAYSKEIGEYLGDTATSRSHMAILTIIFYVTFDVTNNLVQVPVQLYVADFAGSKQTLGASIGQTWANIGAFIVPTYVMFFGPPQNHMHPFMNLLSFLMFITMVAACFVVKEKQYVLEGSNLKVSAGQAFMTEMKNMVTVWFKLPKQLGIFCIAMMLLVYGYQTTNQNRGALFGKDIYGGDAANADNCGDNCSHAQDLYNEGVKMSTGTMDFYSQIIGFLWTLVLPVLIRSFGFKKIYVLATLPIPLFILFVAKIKILSLALLLFSGIINNTIYGLFVPTVIEATKDVENLDIGLYFGALNAAPSFGNFLNFFIASYFVQTSLGYILPVIIGSGISILGLLIVIFFSKIDYRDI